MNTFKTAQEVIDYLQANYQPSDPVCAVIVGAEDVIWAYQDRYLESPELYDSNPLSMEIVMDNLVGMAKDVTAYIPTAIASNLWRGARIGNPVEELRHLLRDTELVEVDRGD